MENVNLMRVRKAEAETAYRQYVEALRKKRTEFLHDMKVVYGHLRFGRGVIDVWDAFAKTGLDTNHDPKIAVAPITAKSVHFLKEQDWSRGQWCGRFTPDVGIARRRYKFENRLEDGEVFVPRGTWSPEGGWAWTYLGETRDANGTRHVPTTWTDPNRQHIEAAVPIVPPKFIPENGIMRKLYVLWEVEKWSTTNPPGRDPLLLSRVNANTFAVLAAWDITDVERAVLRGRLR